MIFKAIYFNIYNKRTDIKEKRPTKANKTVLINTL